MTGRPPVLAPDWIALADAPDAAGPRATGGWLDRGSLVLEFAVPLLGGPAVLLEHRTGTGPDEWALSVFADPMGGIAVRHRQGRAMARHTLPGPLTRSAGGVARLIWSWSGPEGRRWLLRLDDRASGHDPQMRRGEDALKVPGEGMRALCGGRGAFRHPAVLWFGLAAEETVREAGAWIGLQTPVETPQGMRRAHSLRPGDRVIAGGDAARILSAERTFVPARGSHTPVLLRAPYFGAQSDLLVSPGQPVAMAGPVVEYLFGEEAVLVEARHLVDGRAALFHGSRAVAEVVRLTLDRSGSVAADGCALAVPGPGSSSHRLLRPYEAPSLLAQLGRGPQVRAA